MMRIACEGSAALARRPASNTALMLAAVVFAACGRDAGANVARTPESAGTVWELDSAASRAAAPAALLAYVNGLHVVVVDGSTVYAGMTRLEAVRAAGGGWKLQLPGGLEAALIPTTNAMELTFSSGEKIGMHRRQAKEGD